MKFFYSALILIVALSESLGQSMANYTTVRNTSVAYTSISSTGNSFASWRNTVSNTQDDNRSDFTNIGFDFWYNGVRYTQFCVSTNGFIDFSTSTDDGGPQGDDFGFNNAAISAANSNNSTRPAIAPFYDDLTAQGGVAALGTSIMYAVSGTAPNRTLTVEWINMAVFGNVSPSLNFQVKLMESTGVIMMNYGTMTSGTNVFSYSMGMNGPTLSFIPTAAQLKLLQTVNGNTFNNTVQNNLSAMPAANSQYVFTPPVPTATSGNLTFSGVSQTSMTLNWTNWASNEIGYVIYNSTDGINFDFVGQTAVNATSFSATGLLPSTTYYWKVYAVTEGRLSAALNGTQTTNPAGNKISNQSGNWNTASIWTPNGVPTAADNVTIANGHVVSINVSGQCNNLTVGQGGAATLRFNGATSRTLNVNNNITVNTAATFNVNTTSNVTHSVVVEGNLANNGTIDFATDNNSLADVVFSKNGNQTLSGNGSNNFNRMQVSLTGATDVMEISANNFAAASGFLDLVSGIFKISTVNGAVLTPFTGATTISANTGLWLNSANLTVNTGAGVVLNGSLNITNGVFNVGNATNEDLELVGANVAISSGSMNIAGKLDGSDINNTCSFNLSGGRVTVPTVGSTNTSIAPFHISGAGSECNLTGGVIVIQREGGNGNQNLGFLNTGTSGAVVVGGTLQIGDASTPAGQTMDINTDLPIANLRVSSANATARLNTNDLAVTQTINIVSGTLEANNLNISLGGNWINSGLFTPGTASVTFNSANAQSILKTGGETFNHLTFEGAGVKTFLSPVTAAGNFSIAPGASVDVGASSFSLAVKGNLVNNGTLTTRSGSVMLNGTSSQSIGGSSTTNFYDLTLNNSAGAVLNGPAGFRGALTLNNGILNTNSQNFTLISDASGTGRIAPIPGTGDITGNVTFQRYMPGGATGWALLGNPVSSALTFNDWDDDLFISCASCPDGNAGNFTSVYSYDETVGGLYDAAASYIGITSINNSLIAGKGYWLYLGNGQFTTTAITLDVTGATRKFNYAIPLYYTNTGSPANDGWNLIHNPYPSAISWTSLRGATANIDNAIYVYNADLNAGAGGFASYVNGISSPAVASGGTGDNIPMFQGFYVHSTGATVLNAQESHKVSTNPTFLRSSSITTNPLLRIQLKGPGAFSDETVLYFQPNATDTFDTAFDSYKMRGQDPYAPFLALETGTNALQINGIAPLNGNYTAPLKALTGYSGSYTITADNLGSFPKGACITLYDKFTSVTTDLRASDYAFNLIDTTTVARFNLSVTMNSLTVASSVQQPSCKSPGNGLIKAASPTGTGPWNYYWTSNGTAVQTSLNKFTADSLYNLYGGAFELQVNSVGLCDYSESIFNITPQVAATAQFNTASSTYTGLPASVQFNNSSSNAAAYDWDFGTGQDVSSASSPLFVYNLPGMYHVSLVATSATGCKDTTHQSITITDEAAGIQEPGKYSESFLLKTTKPNSFLLEAGLGEETVFTATLSDHLGKLLVNYGDQSGNTELAIDLGNYAPGIYLLTVISEKGKRVIKLPVN